MNRPFVLVGAGQASAVAARTLRRRGYDGPIVIVGDEQEAPYQRPPLSKEFLATGDEEGLYLLPPDWVERNAITLQLGVRATRIRAAAGAVELSDGTELAASQILLATGGRPRRLSGTESRRVHYLRTIDDSRRLRALLTPGMRLIVIGAGFIGLEVAATARAQGAHVTIVEALAVPLERVLGADIGAVCADLHRTSGIDLRLNEVVESIVDVGEEVVVTTTSGPIVGDAVVVGIGIRPNVELALESDLAVDNGVLVDEFCQTSLPNVFAAGDVANHLHPLWDERIRVEHFDNASRQGATAARNMLGEQVAFDDPHWFWSDQHAHNLQYVGHAPRWDQLVIRGSLDDLDFSAFFLLEGRLRAAFAIDRGDDVMAAKELLSLRCAVAPEQLADEDLDLLELAEPTRELA